jgi:biotin carboxylase
MTVSHQGGVFSTSICAYDSQERKDLEEINRKLINAFELEKGVTHAEFLRSREDGKYYLLEVACRVGGAYIANVLDAAAGFSLWREWAKLELETEENPYQIPEQRRDYAGVAISLANTETPDTSAYDDPEIVYRVSKPRHVGLRITRLLCGAIFTGFSRRRAGQGKIRRLERNVKLPLALASGLMK